MSKVNKEYYSIVMGEPMSSIDHIGHQGELGVSPGIIGNPGNVGLRGALYDTSIHDTATNTEVAQ